jgi:hypothetical protein
MASHAEQRRKGVVASLENAGIGRSYHNRTLGEFPKHTALMEWVRSGNAKTDVRAGKARTFIGEGAVAYDMAMLTARGLHLSGAPSFVVSLRRLVKWLEVRGEVEGLENARTAEALFVTDFYQVYDKGECPLTGWQLQDVEAFLGDRLNDARAVFLHTAKPLAKTGWWSGNFVQRVSRMNVDVEAAG